VGEVYIDHRLDGDVVWGCEVTMGRDLADEAYELVGKRMVNELGVVLAKGYRMIGEAEVEEDYDFLRNATTLRARVRLRRGDIR
jgi:hypothetical protein